MTNMMMSVVAAAGLLASFTRPALAQSDSEPKSRAENYGYVPEGKRIIRKIFPHTDEVSTMPGTVRIEVEPQDRQPGDDWGYKTVGKHTELAYYREVEGNPVEMAPTSCDGKCSFGYFPVTAKRTERRTFCEMNGDRTFCGHQDGECAMCADASSQ